MPTARALALLALLVLPASLAAQGGATALPGRLEKRFTSRTSIEGLPDAETRRLRGAAERAAAILAAHPQVVAPPAGTCLRLYTFLPGGVEGPRAPAEASVSIAERYDARGCSERTTSGVLVRLNDAARLLREDGTLATEMRDDAGPIVVIPRIGTTRDGHEVVLLNGARSVVLTRDGKSLLVPVTKERFLRYRIAEAERAIAGVQSVRVDAEDPLERWRRETKPSLVAGQEEALRAMRGSASAEEIARRRAANAELIAKTEEGIRRMSEVLATQHARKSEAVGPVEQELLDLRARLADMPAAERRAPACASSDLSEWFAECTDGNRYVSLAPDYFSPTLPKSAIQVIVVSTPHGRHNMEATGRAALRWRIFDELAYGDLAALLR